MRHRVNFKQRDSSCMYSLTAPHELDVIQSQFFNQREDSWIRLPSRLELTREGLLVKLANHFTTRDAVRGNSYVRYFPVSRYRASPLSSLVVPNRYTNITNSRTEINSSMYSTNERKENLYFSKVFVYLESIQMYRRHPHMFSVVWDINTWHKNR